MLKICMLINPVSPVRLMAPFSYSQYGELRACIFLNQNEDINPANFFSGFFTFMEFFESELTYKFLQIILEVGNFMIFFFWTQN